MFQKLFNKLKTPEDSVRQQNEDEDDNDEIQVADDESSNDSKVLPALYQAVSPVIDAIVPSAEAARLSDFNPDDIRVISAKQKSNFKPPSQDEIKQFIADEAKRRGKDPALVLAHFEKESSFNPSAFNKKGGGKGARGLTQIREPAFTDAKKFDTTGRLKNLKFEDMSKPENWKENVIAGLNYYDVANKYWKPKSTEQFLKSYNQGSPSSKGFKSREAQEYANDVLARYARQKQYINSLDSNRALSSVNPRQGEPLAQQKNFSNLIKRLRK